METGKIYIPEEFDGFDVEIEKYKEKLNDEDLNPKKREQYEGILARLEERKDL